MKDTSGGVMSAYISYHVRIITAFAVQCDVDPFLKSIAKYTTGVYSAPPKNIFLHYDIITLLRQAKGKCELTCVLYLSLH